MRLFVLSVVSLVAAFQILDRVNGNLTPKPFGVEAKAIEVPLAEGSATIFVVSVPSSVTSAHQSTRSWRYYKRIADGDQPMLDYEIRDVNNRRTGPLLLLEVNISDPEYNGGHIQHMPDGKGSYLTPKEGRFLLVLTTSNVGRATAPVAQFDIGIPNGWGVVGVSGVSWFKVTAIEQQMYESVTVFMGSAISRVVPRRQRTAKIVEQPATWYRRRWPISDTQDYPLWPSPEIIVPLGLIQLQMPTSTDENVWLPWRIMAEGMPDMRGAAFLKRDRSDLTVINFELNDIDWAVGLAEDQRYRRLFERYGVR